MHRIPQEPLRRSPAQGHPVRLPGTGGGTDDSDVDLAVVLDGPVAPFEELKRIVTAFVDSGLERYLDLSPVPLSQSEWDDPGTSTNPGLIESIRKDGVVVWQGLLPVRSSP